MALMKKMLTLIIKLTVASILIWFLIHTSKLDPHLLIDILHSPIQLSLTILIYIAVIVLGTWRWYLLNKVQRIHLNFKQTLLPTYLGVAFNNVLPGGVGGDFYRFYFINKHILVKKSAIMLTLLFDRITGLLGIFIAVSIIALCQLSVFLHKTMTLYFILFCLLICIGGLGTFFISMLLPPTTGLSKFLSRHFNGKKWLNAILSLLDAIKVYRNSKITIITCLIISVIIQGMIAITCLLIANMMGFPSIPFSYCLLAIGVTQIVNLIPISPGGFGLGEMAFANVLSLLNPAIGGTYATIFLAYRLIGIVFYLPGIGILLIDKRFFDFDKPIINKYSVDLRDES